MAAAGIDASPGARRAAAAWPGPSGRRQATSGSPGRWRSSRCCPRCAAAAPGSGDPRGRLQLPNADRLPRRPPRTSSGRGARRSPRHLTRRSIDRRTFPHGGNGRSPPATASRVSRRSSWSPRMPGSLPGRGGLGQRDHDRVLCEAVAADVHDAVTRPADEIERGAPALRSGCGRREAASRPRHRRRPGSGRAGRHGRCTGWPRHGPPRPGTALRGEPARPGEPAVRIGRPVADGRSPRGRVRAGYHRRGCQNDGTSARPDGSAPHCRQTRVVIGPQIEPPGGQPVHRTGRSPRQPRGPWM